MKIIAVDFDGTIAKTRFPYIVELIPEASYIPRWRSMGHKVVLWTCREGEVLEQALQFCAAHNIKFDGVNENINPKYTDNPRKISADFYIDDKCPVPVVEQYYAVDMMLDNVVTKKRRVTATSSRGFTKEESIMHSKMLDEISEVEKIAVVTAPKVIRARGR